MVGSKFDSIPPCHLIATYCVFFLLSFFGPCSGFNPTSNYTGFLAGSDRVALDTHPYLCFQALEDAGPEEYAKQPCSTWAGKINTTTGVCFLLPYSLYGGMSAR